MIARRPPTARNPAGTSHLTGTRRSASLTAIHAVATNDTGAKQRSLWQRWRLAMHPDSAGDYDDHVRPDHQTHCAPKTQSPPGATEAELGSSRGKSTGAPNHSQPPRSEAPNGRGLHGSDEATTSAALEGGWSPVAAALVMRGPENHAAPASSNRRVTARKCSAEIPYSSPLKRMFTSPPWSISVAHARPTHDPGEQGGVPNHRTSPHLTLPGDHGEPLAVRIRACAAAKTLGKPEGFSLRASRCPVLSSDHRRGGVRSGGSGSG